MKKFATEYIKLEKIESDLMRLDEIIYKTTITTFKCYYLSKVFCDGTLIEGLQWAFLNYAKTLFRHFEWIAESEWLSALHALRALR